MWDAESRFGLLAWEVNGVKPWQAARFAIFQTLSSALGLYEDTPDETPRGWWGRLGLHCRLLRGALAWNPFIGSQRYDALIFEGARSIATEGGRVCPYTHDIANSLARQGKRVQLLDTHFAGLHSKSPDPRRRFVDAVGIESALRFRLSRWAPSATELSFLSTVEKHLAKVTATDVDLSWLLSPGVRRFRASYATYRRLLELRRPSDLYCVCAHVNLAPLVAAAKHLGIRVTEVQHAVISRHHVGYSYPRHDASATPHYFPDRMLVWDGDWNDLPNLPCALEKTPPNWARLTQAHSGTAKKKGMMVVLSQPPIARRLAEVLWDRRARLSRFEIVVKLHPAELREPILREAYAALSGAGNISIAQGDHLYDLLPPAEFQLGVYSTAIYQGIDVGCRTLLAPLPGVEHLSHLVSNGRARWLDEFLDSEG